MYKRQIYINVSNILNILLDEQIKPFAFSQGTTATEDKSGGADGLSDPRNDMQGLLVEAENLLEGVESSDNMDENSTVAKKDSHLEFRSCLLDHRLEADKSVTGVSRKNENDSISVNPKTNEVASLSLIHI